MKIYKYYTGPLQVNTYLVYDEDTKEGFIVDPGGYSKQLVETIEKLSLKIDYIILTHGHGDHIGGVEQYQQQQIGKNVIAHEEEKELLKNGKLNCSEEIYGVPMTVSPDKYVKDQDDFQIGNMVLKFIFTPGHTKGGMCIYCEGHLFSGDTLFRYSIGRTDFYGGDFQTLLRSIKEKLFILPEDTIVLPGHMDKTTIGEEKRGNPFV